MAKRKTMSKTGIAKSKKQGGAVKLTEGPLDSASHSELSNSQLSKHINIMQDRMKSYHDKLLSEKEKYNNTAAELKIAREEYESERARSLEKIEAQKLANKERNHELAMQSTNSSLETMKNFYKGMGDILNKLGKILASIGNGIVHLGSGSKNIGSGLNNFGKLSLRNDILKFIARVLIILLILIILILIIFFIWWLIDPDAVSRIFQGKGAAAADDEADGEAGGGGEDSCKNVTEINVGNFGVISKFNLSKFNNLLGNQYDKISSYRPEFPSIPKTPVFNILNPLDGIKSYANVAKQKILNSDFVSTVSKNLGTINPKPIIETTRESLANGRCDNVIMIDAELINNKNVLNNVNTMISKTAINIGKPDDIKWKMPTSDYKNQDISQVPDSMRNLKDTNDVSLNDKQTIVIPWVKKNNNYSLSCSGAYFENSIDELANVLSDNEDGKTCRFNIESKAISYDEPKDRYKYTQDLSTFL